MIENPRIRRRVYTPDQLPYLVIGELARDVDSVFVALWKAMAELEARPSGASITYAAPGSILPDDAISEGVATTVARSDHTHGITAAAAGAVTPGDTAAEGTASSFARSDHKHSLPAYGTTAGTFCQGNDSRLSDSRTPTGHHTSHEAGGSDAIKIDDLAAGDDNTDLNVSTSKHGLMVKLPNDATKIFDGVGTWRVPAVAKVWDGRVVPSGLHADSDEFDDGSVAGTWLDFDHGGWVTTTEESPINALVHTGTGSASSRAAGKYKAIPSNEFQFWAQVSVDGAAGGTAGTNAWLVGLAVFADASNSASSFCSVELNNNNPDTSSICTMNQRQWTNYTTPGTPLFRNTMVTTVWLRMRVIISGSTTTIGNDWSTDGVQWSQIGNSPRSFGTAVTHYGVIMNSNVNTVVVRVMHQHFRVVSASGASGFNYFKNGGFLGA